MKPREYLEKYPQAQPETKEDWLAFAQSFADEHGIDTVEGKINIKITHVKAETPAEVEVWRAQIHKEGSGEMWVGDIQKPVYLALGHLLARTVKLDEIERLFDLDNPGE